MSTASRRPALVSGQVCVLSLRPYRLVMATILLSVANIRPECGASPRYRGPDCVEGRMYKIAMEA